MNPDGIRHQCWLVFGHLMPGGWAFPAVFCGLLVAFSGCHGRPAPAGLEGVVTFQDKPVAKGAIRLVNEDGTPGPGGVAPIVDGHYQILEGSGLYTGSYIVAIYGFQETGRMIKVDDSSPERPEERQYLPRRYNDASQERLFLQPGLNTQNFDLAK